MVIMVQSKKAVVLSQHVENVFAGSDGLAIKINFTSGRGSEAAKYSDRDKALYALDMFFVACRSGEDFFEFPSDRDIAEKMAIARQHSSHVTSRKISHGGS